MSVQKDLLEFVKLAKLWMFKGKYEYFCTTGDKNFKCVFLEKYFIL